MAAEQGGFDGFFLWDHLVHDDTGDGPPVLDPWPLLAVLASQTSRIRLGTLITPVPRRRPWQLAKETVTVDRLSDGRLILGVGLGSPPYADFGIFHEPTSRPGPGRTARRGAGGADRAVDRGPVRVQRRALHRRAGPVPPGAGAAAAYPDLGWWRAARRRAGAAGLPVGRDGAADAGTVTGWSGRRPEDIAAVREQAQLARGSAAGFDLVVWAELEQEPGEVAGLAPAYVGGRRHLVGGERGVRPRLAGPGHRAGSPRPLTPDGRCAPAHRPSGDPAPYWVLISSGSDSVVVAGAGVGRWRSVR